MCNFFTGQIPSQTPDQQCHNNNFIKQTFSYSIYTDSLMLECSDEDGVALLSGDKAVSSTALSVLLVTAAGVAMTTRSARLLPNTNSDCVELESVGLVVTAVLLSSVVYNTAAMSAHSSVSKLQ